MYFWHSIRDHELDSENIDLIMNHGASEACESFRSVVQPYLNCTAYCIHSDSFLAPIAVPFVVDNGFRSLLVSDWEGERLLVYHDHTDLCGGIALWETPNTLKMWDHQKVKTAVTPSCLKVLESVCVCAMSQGNFWPGRSTKMLLQLCQYAVSTMCTLYIHIDW